MRGGHHGRANGLVRAMSASLTYPLAKRKRVEGVVSDFEFDPAFDPYRVLGVDRGEQIEKIKLAYRQAARESHPDRNKSKTAAEREAAAARFKAVNRAWEILGDPDRRKEYDRLANRVRGA